MTPNPHQKIDSGKLSCNLLIVSKLKKLPILNVHNQCSKFVEKNLIVVGLVTLES